MKTLTEEHKQKIREGMKRAFQEGRNKPPMLGKKHTPEAIQKMKQAHQRRRELGLPGANKGRKFSDEWIKHLSEATKGKNNPMYGRKHSKEAREKNQ